MSWGRGNERVKSFFENKKSLEIVLPRLFAFYQLVGVRGFEPPASWSRTMRSTKLSHTPIKLKLKLQTNGVYCNIECILNQGFF